MKYGIFTKPVHVEKIVNYLNQNTDLDYIISTSKNDVYAYDFDIGVSYCFQELLDVEYGDRKWFNYHPAPMKYPGVTNYVKPISDGVTKFGVTLHRMTAEFDKGEVVLFMSFKLKSKPVHHNELGNITHYYLFQLFKKTISKLVEF